jgi:ribosomal protein S12 methylthiotransferase
MKIGLVSLGCPKNLVDSEVMLGLAQQAGHHLTADPANADVIVVNTCAFIDSAKQESIDAILEMARHKTEGNCQRLVVTGCLAERYRDTLRKEIPEIDAVLGTGEVPEIVNAIGGAAIAPGVSPLTFFRAPSPESRAPSYEPPSYIYDADTPRLLATPRHYAYIKIAEGCDYKCAFCIIPTLRGHYRSRPADSIVREAESLAARGVKELLLVSQDTTFYGIDRDERGALARLLRRLNAVQGLEWIRLLYLYPTTIDDDTLAAMAGASTLQIYRPAVAARVNPVLARMKRPGTRRNTPPARSHPRLPGVALRRPIVGFPETAADVDQLTSFVRAHEFDHVGVFTYSHEEGTSAFALDDDVPQQAKVRRRNTVMGVQKRLVRQRQRRRIGERARLLIDGPAGEHDLVLRGRLASQAPDIDASVYLTDCDPSGYRSGICRGPLVGAKDYDLVAARAIIWSSEPG